MKSLAILVSLIFTSVSFSLHASNCTIDNKRKEMSCIHKEYEVDDLVGKRKVLIAIPEKDAPASGYPAVFFFQGSFFPIDFSRKMNDGFGGYNEILTIKALLDSGYIVIAPKAEGGLFWQTNIIGLNYDKGTDHDMINSLYDFLKEQNEFPIDLNNLFATGISSGGYMTDRMAQSHQHISFRAFAIASASYAKCGGLNCRMPDNTSLEQPPTLFLHGSKDLAVPIFTMRKYEKLLRENGVRTKVIVDEGAGHEWLTTAPIEIISWFNSHLLP